MLDGHIIAEIIANAVALLTAVLIATKARGINETRLTTLESSSVKDGADIHTEIKEIREQLTAMNVRLETFITALIGVDGKNGLRGDLRALEAKVDSITSIKDA